MKGGLWMLSVGDPEPDNTTWDKLDDACGIRTREPVHRAMDPTFPISTLHGVP